MTVKRSCAVGIPDPQRSSLASHTMKFSMLNIFAAKKTSASALFFISCRVSRDECTGGKLRWSTQFLLPKRLRGAPLCMARLHTQNVYQCTSFENSVNPRLIEYSVQCCKGNITVCGCTDRNIESWKRVWATRAHKDKAAESVHDLCFRDFG